MKVLGDRVLVREIMTKKRSKIIQLDNKNPDTFDISMEVLQIGKGCPKDCEIKVGDTPILGEFAQTNTRRIVESSKDKIISEIIVFYSDIAGIDD